MRRNQASQTAGWVAAARTVGAVLPRELVLAHDPYGVRFAEGLVRLVSESLLARPALAGRLLMRAGPLTAFLLWMQLRTRALDEVLLTFVRAGGRQIVLLGAGYDCRALRFREELGAAVVFEVDHPSTQRRKLRKLPGEQTKTQVVYVPWDFEHDPLEKLPERLRDHGLDSSARVLTIWEGVTMYLTEPTIQQTVEMVRELSGPESWLAFTYLDQRAITAPRGDAKLTARLVERVGEPYRFGWDPEDLPLWFAVRGFELVSDATDAELAARYFPSFVWQYFARKQRHLAVMRKPVRRDEHA